MKISVNDEELFTLSETQRKVICDYLPEDIFEEDMKRRVKWVLMHIYEQAYEQLKKSWDSKLSERCDAIPTDKDKLAELIFSQPDYKCRKRREAEVENA